MASLWAAVGKAGVAACRVPVAWELAGQTKNSCCTTLVTRTHPGKVEKSTFSTLRRHGTGKSSPRRRNDIRHAEDHAHHAEAIKPGSFRSSPLL